MAAGVSKWTKIGSPKVSTIANDSATEENNFIGPGDIGIPRHEMHFWLDDAQPIFSEPFDWKVSNSFSVLINGGYAGSPGSNGQAQSTVYLNLQIEGSVSGHPDSYLIMQSYTEFQPIDGSIEDKRILLWNGLSGRIIYDYYANGALPYMRLSIKPASDVDNTDKPAKVIIEDIS